MVRVMVPGGTAGVCTIGGGGEEGGGGGLGMAATGEDGGASAADASGGGDIAATATDVVVEGKAGEIASSTRALLAGGSSGAGIGGISTAAADTVVDGKGAGTVGGGANGRLRPPASTAVEAAGNGPPFPANIDSPCSCRDACSSMTRLASSKRLLVSSSCRSNSSSFAAKIRGDQREA